MVIGKSLTPSDTIDHHQIYLNKKPLLFAHANTPEADLKILLWKKNLKNKDKDKIVAVYSTCTRNNKPYQMSLKDTQGKLIWETSTQTHTRVEIPISVWLKTNEKELFLYVEKKFLAKITIY